PSRLRHRRVAPPPSASPPSESPQSAAVLHNLGSPPRCIAVVYISSVRCCIALPSTTVAASPHIRPPLHKLVSDRRCDSSPPPATLNGIRMRRISEEGLLLEFWKDPERLVLVVVEKPDGKKNWILTDQHSNVLVTQLYFLVFLIMQNGNMTSIKPQQITFIVPGVDNLLACQQNFIRRPLLNEDESGFKRAKIPIYYDRGLEVNVPSKRNMEYRLIIHQDMHPLTMKNQRSSCGCYGDQVYRLKAQLVGRELMDKLKKFMDSLKNYIREEFIDYLIEQTCVRDNSFNLPSGQRSLQGISKFHAVHQNPPAPLHAGGEGLGWSSLVSAMRRNVFEKIFTGLMLLRRENCWKYKGNKNMKCVSSKDIP
ncbi:elongation factor 4, partial [Striga asiatica]